MIILASILAMLVYGMIASTLGTILPDLSKRYGLTPKENGTIAFAQAMGLMIASLLVGPLMDAEGQKAGLVLGLIIAAIALFALPTSRTFASIAALMFLLGVGGGSIVTAANSLASSISAEHRATALNLVNLFFGLGGLATPFIAANFLGKSSTKLCYLVAAVTTVTLAIDLTTTMPAPTRAQSFAFPEIGRGLPLLFLLAFFVFLYVACEVGVWNWLVRHLVAEGIPESRALNILSLGFALGLLIGRVAVSPILIRVPATAVMLGSALAMTVTTYLMVRAKSPAMAGALVFLAGVSMAPAFPTALAVVGDAFPAMASTALGLVIASGWLGLAVSSRIIGAIAGSDPKRLTKALLVIPAFSAIMVAVDLAIRAAQ